MIKLMYKPFSILAGVLGGILAGVIFKQIWKAVAHEPEAPDSTDVAKGWSEVLVVVRFWILAGLFSALALGVFYADFLAKGRRGRPKKLYRSGAHLRKVRMADLLTDREGGSQQLLVAGATSKTGISAKGAARSATWVEAREASKVNYAYLYDRVMLGQGKPQHWGTQGRCKDGKAILSANLAKPPTSR